MSRVDIVAAFRAAMSEAGIDTGDEIVADGRAHRFHVTGDKAGTKNGTYCLYADGVPAGWFGTHRGGWETHTWCLRSEREIPEAERAAHRKRMEEAERSKAAEEAKRKEDARRRAAAIWKGAKACDDAHPYLQRKGVKAHGLKGATWRAWHQTEGGQWQERRIAGALLVPMRDAKGALHSLQALFPERDAVLGRDKDFLPGGEKRGCYHAIGKPAGVILVAEGYATGASLHEATGHAVAVAFDCGNLKPVAEALRAKYPEARLIVCADNDQFTEGNPGVTKGREAADAAGAGLALPEFADLAGEPTDFNDLAQREGMEKVKEAIQAALQALGDISPSPAPGKPRSGRDSQPAGADAPAAKAQHGRRFELNERGLWLHEPEKSPRWIAPPLEVVALVRDHANCGWGLLLAFDDRDWKRHRVIIPHAFLKGEGAEALALLLDRGFIPAHKSESHLIDYLKRANPEKRARVTDRTGWHEGGVFVLPDRSIGAAEEEVIFQSDAPGTNNFKTKGTLESWREHVAKPCAGNSRLVFAVSAAFASALLHPAGAEGGGFHYRGGSSAGKTTLLRVAASVCGGPEFMQRWRATDNGLEAMALQHCDSPLLLDELAQLDPRAAGEVAYMLANGSGKSRAARTGTLRERANWRVLFQSAGEIGLAEHMAEAGKRTRAGQEIRLCEIPSDAGTGLGCFEDLRGQANGSEFARMLDQATRRHYGTAWLAFLEAIIAELDSLPGLLRELQRKFEAQYLSGDAGGQALRVSGRFALVAGAGELATKLGLTGWQPGEALQAAGACLKAWLSQRGGESNQEERAMLAQVREFFERHGEARFADWERPATKDDHAPRVINKAGFRRHDEVEDRTEWYVYPQVWRSEVCKGFDPREVARLLSRHGMIEATKEEKHAHTPKIDLPGEGRRRVYRVLPALFGDDDA